MTSSNFQYQLGSMASTAIQADSAPTATTDANGRPGWSYTKVSGDEKFNYYFYNGTHEAMKHKEVKSMFFCGSIDQWSNQTSEAPFFVIYTKMKMDGTDAGAWYHSKHAYALHKDTQLIRPGEKCLFYCLQIPEEEFGGVRKIPLRTRIDTGEHDLEDEVLFMTLQSDSGAAEQSTYVESLGANICGFGRCVGPHSINMKLIS